MLKVRTSLNIPEGVAIVINTKLTSNERRALRDMSPEDQIIWLLNNKKASVITNIGKKR